MIAELLRKKEKTLKLLNFLNGIIHLQLLSSSEYEVGQPTV